MATPLQLKTSSSRTLPEIPLLSQLYAAIRGIGLSSRNWQTSWYGRTGGANPSQEQMSKLVWTDNGVRRKMGLPALTAGPSLIARLAGAVPHFDEETPAERKAQDHKQGDADREKRSAADEASATCPPHVPLVLNGGLPCVQAPEPAANNSEALPVLSMAGAFGKGIACHGGPNMTASDVFNASNRTVFFPIGLELDIISAEIVLSFQAGSGRMVISPCGLQRLREHWCNISSLIAGAETPEFLEPDYLAPDGDGMVTVLLGKAELERLRPTLQDARIVDYLWCELWQAADPFAAQVLMQVRERERKGLIDWLHAHDCGDLLPAGTDISLSFAELQALQLVCLGRDPRLPLPPPVPPETTRLLELQEQLNACIQEARSSLKNLSLQSVYACLRNFSAESGIPLSPPVSTPSSIPSPAPASTPAPTPAPATGLAPDAAPSPSPAPSPSSDVGPQPGPTLSPSTINIPAPAKAQPPTQLNATASNGLPETAIAAIAVMAAVIGVPSILIAVSTLHRHCAGKATADAVTEIPLESLQVVGGKSAEQ